MSEDTQDSAESTEATEESEQTPEPTPPPEWTVMVPIYAAKQGKTFAYLRETIESVQAQTFTAWKLVVVDDGSPAEGVKELVESFADDRLEYFRNEENKGQAGNLNVCIEKNESPYFTILHADDQLLPNYAEKMISIAKNNSDVAGVFCEAEIINEKGRVVPSVVDCVKGWMLPPYDFKLEGERGLLKILKGNFIMCPTMLFNKENWGGLRFNESNYHYTPDYWMWTEALLKGRALFRSPLTLFRYRRHSANATAYARKGLVGLKEEKELFAELAQKAHEQGMEKAAKRAERSEIVKKRALFFAAKDFVQGHFSAAADKLRFALGS